MRAYVGGKVSSSRVELTALVSHDQGMASDAYYAWVKDGSPYRDTVWLQDQRKIWQGCGFTFWTKGDEDHLRAEVPQDHTPFSKTGWPVPSAYGVGHAFDVPNPPSSLPPLWQVAEQIIKDKNAKVPGTEWIKYLNYTDKNGDCWHISWQPNYAKTKSDDRNHLHVSGRSDMDTAHTTYDPIARLGEDMADALTAKQAQQLTAIDARLRPFVSGNAGPYDVPWTVNPDDRETMWAVLQLQKIDDLLIQVKELKALISDLQESIAHPPVVIPDLENLVNAVVQGLRDHPLAPQ